MAKKRKKRRTAKQKAATAKMLRANKSARRARREFGGGAAKPKRRRRSSMRRATGTSAPRKRARRVAAKASPRRRRKSGSSRRRAPRSRTQTTRTVIQKLPGHTTRIAVVPVPAATRTSRKRKGGGGKRRKSRKGASRKRRLSPGAGGGFGHRSRKGAMENPMTGVELFVGGVTGVFGFLTADFIDRVMATHSLTVATAATATTAGTYTDTPPSTGDYAGLYNATAICAPMDAKRWIVGVLTAGVPLTIAHFIAAPTGRAALQFFGVAAGFRIVGKGLIDLVAMVSKNTQLGQQLYDGEMRAMMLKDNGGAQTGSGGNLATLPSAGLGRARLGAGCACGGQCAQCKTMTKGAGYPSMPREVAAAQAATPPPPPPPVAVTQPTQQLSNTSVTAPPASLNPMQSTLTGVPKPRSRFSSWGDPNVQ